MESHEKGDFTEAAVIAELKRRRIPVLLPFSDNQRYDVVVETPGGAMQAMQIKTGWLSDGVIDFHTKSQHTNATGNVYEYYDGEIDGFLVYVHQLETMYLIYIDEFDRKISLRVEEPAQADSSINWADEYAFDARWPPQNEHVRSVTDGRSPAVKPVGEHLEKQNVPFTQVTDEGYHFVARGQSGDTYRLRACSGRIVDGLVRFPTKGAEAIDAYCVYCSATDDIYLVWAEEFDYSISLRTDSPGKSDPSINWASDYEFDERWPP